MKIQNALVSNILDRSQRYFAHVTTVTLSWRVQNIVVIGVVYFTPEWFEFSSNFEFDRNMLSGTGAWYQPYSALSIYHDAVIKWKHFPRNWPFERGIHRSPVNSPHKGQWRGALMFSLVCVWINGWVNNREAGDLRRYRGHYDVIAISW